VVTACPAWRDAGRRGGRVAVASTRTPEPCSSCAVLHGPPRVRRPLSRGSRTRVPQGPQIQGRYGVRFLTYWFDEERQTAFCLAKAASADAVEEVRRASTATWGTRSSRSTSPRWRTITPSSADRTAHGLDESCSAGRGRSRFTWFGRQPAATKRLGALPFQNASFPGGNAYGGG
jgi:hypothetical protein